MQNSPLRTSFRSATHATDSTRNGWMAKSAAASAPAPDTTGHPLQDEEQQDDGSGVQQEVREMVPSGSVVIDFPIEHVGNPCHRDPRAFVAVCESPSDRVQRQPVRNMIIVVDALIIVEIDKLVADRLTEN